jgi:hypothetical protein
MMQSVPRTQKPCRRMSPWLSSLVGLLVSYFLCSTTWVNQGLVTNCSESKCFPSQVYLSSSHILLCQKIMRPPFLQPSACCKVNWDSQPWQVCGRSGGVMPYLIKRASQNSWTESSLPLMVEGRTESHARKQY